MHQPSGLSVNAAPFQPRAAMPAPRLAEVPRDRPEAGRKGSLNGRSPPGRTTTSSVGKVPSPVRGPYPPTSDDDVTSDRGLVSPSSRRKGKRSRGSRGSRSGEGSDSSHPVRSSASSGGRRKKKDGFSSKIQIPEFGGKKGHSGEVTDAFRQWVRCITYYRDYYEDSYLMPLVVSSLTGDALDVFDWILSLNQGEPQDLTTLLQMLREHYCGSLTFREQRNAIENLCQRSKEAAIDFLIRVGTLVSNLAKDWKDELTEGELWALQNEVLLNGVKEEIRHVLDSEIAKRDSHLMPQQMYEAVKKYETYVARNRRGTSTPAGQRKAAGQPSGYKPQFHKTTAFVATAGVPNDESDHPPGEDSDSHEIEPPLREDEGLYIPSYLKEAIPDDPTLQVKVARALRVQEMNSRRCYTCNRPGHLVRDHQEWEEKNGIRPLQPKGPAPNKMAPAKTPSARTARASSRVERVPYLNPDAFSRFIGPKNWGQALINDELTTCLLDNGAQLNFITPAYAVERGMDIMSLDQLAQEIGGPLPLITGMGGSLVEPTGFVLMNIKVPCVQGYTEDQVALVMDDPGMTECPVILGTSTLYWVMEVIKESEISKLAVPWSSSRISWLMQDVAARLGQVVMNDVANKPIAPLGMDEVVRVASKCTVPPFSHKVIHGKVNLVLCGCRLNLMTHGLEKRSPSLPLGIDVQTAYSTLANGSNRVPVVLRNNTQDWLEVKKGVPIARMVTANAIPKVTHILPAGNPHELPTLTEAERQELLLEKLDLTGLEAWPTEQAEKARSLLREYHDIFSLEKHDTGHTKAAKHKIVLKDPETPPFK